MHTERSEVREVKQTPHVTAPHRAAAAKWQSSHIHLRDGVSSSSFNLPPAAHLAPLADKRRRLPTRKEEAPSKQMRCRPGEQHHRGDISPFKDVVHRSTLTSGNLLPVVYLRTPLSILLL